MSGVAGRWLEVRARYAHVLTDPDGDPGNLADALIEVGGRAVEERDGWLVTHLPEPPDPDSFIATLEPRLGAALGAPVSVAWSWCAAEDWAETWKRGLAPRRLTPRLWVTPSWAPAPAEAGDLVIVVDPGMAFGTAEHGTTRGVIRLLDRALVPGERVLDIGSGSAILAVAAALLGASTVTAVEGDPVASEYARENIERNGVSDRVRWIQALADSPMVRALGMADGVVANIESGVLRRLLPGFRDVLAPGRWMILSGIPAEEWEPFSREVVDSGFALVATDADGEWRAGWFTRS